MKALTKMLAIAGATLLTMVSCNNISESQKADIVLENIFARKSVRKFTSEPVSDKQVETLLKAAMAAPSAMNGQPWRFVVVNDKEKLASMSKSLPYERLETAPLAIVVCGDLSGYKKFWTDDFLQPQRICFLLPRPWGLVLSGQPRLTKSVPE